MKKTAILLLLTGLRTVSFAQLDTAGLQQSFPVFDRIAKGISTYKLDTTAAPDDRVTAKIRELRQLGGVFNLTEAIEFKLAEDRQKGEIPAEQLDRLARFFREGAGRRNVDNAVTWIYRNRFTYRELKALVRFYKTPAGKKMRDEFPVIMLQSLAAAQMIKDEYDTQSKKL